MRRKRISPFFFLALIFAILSQYIFPFVKWLPFAPFLTIAYASLTFTQSLWIAAICGLIMDLMGSDHPFGIHALNYVLTTLLLFRYRVYFVEKAIGLASFTFLFSSVSTAIQMGGFFLFGNAIPLTFKGLTSDLLFLPFLDALYGFIWFSFPFFLYNFLKRQWFRFLLFRKDSKRKIEES